MKLFKILTLFIFLADSGFGQVSQMKIPELLKLKTYEHDKEADAFYAYDYGETKFIEENHDIMMKFTHQYRIKVLTKVGINYTNIEIPLYTNGYNKEYLNAFVAKVYNEAAGTMQVTKVDASKLYDEQISSNVTVKKMAIPGVTAGTVIEVYYEVVSPFFFNLHDWDFQHKIPVASSLYKTTMIPFYSYVYILKGLKEIDVLESYKSPSKRNMLGFEFYEKTYRFGLTNIKAFKDETFITSPNDYKIQLDFQLSKYHLTDGRNIEVMSTWERMGREYLVHKDFGKYLKSLRSLSKKIIESHQIIAATPQQTYKNIVNHVKDNYRWDKYAGCTSNRKAKELKTYRSGNCAALNLLIVALCKEAEIDAHPVLISTRDHGKIYSDYPFDHFFNYTIAMAAINGDTILSDATDQHTDFDRLPLRCLNDKGFIVQKSKTNWVDTESDNVSTTHHAFDVSFIKDTANYTYTYSSDGYEAIGEMKRFDSDSSLYLKKTSKRFFARYDLSKAKVNRDKKTFSINLEGNSRVSSINKIISFSPFIRGYLNVNPFTANERDYPVDLIYPKEEIYSSKIQLPEGATLVSVPQPDSLNNDAFEIDYKVENKDNNIIVSARYKIKRAVYPKEYYVKLKSYFEQYINLLSQKIQVKLK